MGPPPVARQDPKCNMVRVSLEFGRNALPQVLGKPVWISEMHDQVRHRFGRQVLNVPLPRSGEVDDSAAVQDLDSSAFPPSLSGQLFVDLNNSLNVGESRSESSARTAWHGCQYVCNPLRSRSFCRELALSPVDNLPDPALSQSPPGSNHALELTSRYCGHDRSITNWVLSHRRVGLVREPAAFIRAVAGLAAHASPRLPTHGAHELTTDRLGGSASGSPPRSRRACFLHICRHTRWLEQPTTAHSRTSVRPIVNPDTPD